MIETRATALIQRYIEQPEFRRFIMGAGGCSMAPTIVSGDRLHMKRVEQAPQNGEIILAQGRSGRHFIHRVVASIPAIITKSDNCADPDEEIIKVIAVLERVEKTPRSRLRRLTMAFRKLIHV